jgi:predicted metal-dependent HD superfamily phosphohydrolase
VIDRTSWAAAWQGIGARTDGADLHHRLVGCWSEKHRHYHTLQHLRECFDHFGGSRAEMQRPAEVAIALWFHDAFYDPERDDNEKRSADWARDAAVEAGVPETTAERLLRMVMATVDHMPQADTDLQLLVDIDLSILGAETARFDESDVQIRREYAHVPESEWRVARRRVLQGFLDRPRLYGTERFHSALEQRARKNIERSLARLGD